MAHFKRWYDYDPLLMEVLELLRYYQDELRSQAEIFIEKIEAQVSKETIEKFCAMAKPEDGDRWYDHDPVISKTVELLRVVPTEVQQKAAKSFIQSLENMGLSVDLAKEINKDQ